jgi:hypothetical protein
MSRTTTITGNQITDALRSLGVNFILGGSHGIMRLHKQPARLIAALSESSEARLPCR